MASIPEQPAYTIKAIEGKGKSLVALRKIPQFTLIFKDTPIIRGGRQELTKEPSVLHGEIAEALHQLGEAKKEAFTNLHSTEPLDSPTRNVNIVKLNSLPLGFAPNCSEYGVFPLAARMNHACVPNAHNSWHPERQELRVYSVNDIEAGQEITISYLRSYLPCKKRRKKLRQAFAFECNCATCSAPDDQKAVTDKGFKFIESCLEANQRREIPTTDAARELLIRVLSSYEVCVELGLQGRLMYTLRLDVADAFLSHSDLARARVAAKRAHQYATWCEGPDSPDAQLALRIAQDPLGYKTPLTDHWKTGKHHIPQGLTRAALRQWIWRWIQYELPCQEWSRALVADFSDTAYFPTREGLPRVGQSPNGFYTNNGPLTTPRKHWCLLAEITAIEPLDKYISLRVVDRLGNPLTVTMSPSTISEGLSTAACGQAVIVMYPEISDNNIVMLAESYAIKVRVFLLAWNEPTLISPRRSVVAHPDESCRPPEAQRNRSEILPPPRDDHGLPRVRQGIASRIGKEV